MRGPRLVIAFAAVVSVHLATTPDARADLVGNGGFELNDPALGTFTDWTVTGSGIGVDTVFPQSGSADAAFSDVTGTSPVSTLSQSIATDPGVAYTLTFQVLDQAGLSADSFNVSFGGFSATFTGDQAAPPGANPGFYTAESLAIPGSDITAATTILTFSASVDPTAGQAWNLDEVSLTEQTVPVGAPEPASLAMLMVGLLTVCASRIRPGGGTPGPAGRTGIHRDLVR